MADKADKAADNTNSTDNVVVDNIRMDAFLQGVFRYVILAILYIICYLHLYSNSTQFILFIVIFILNFFTIVFLYKDFLSVPDLSESLFGDSEIPGSGFTKLFTFAILITLILNIATFGMILAVFDYGKKSTNDYLSYTMTPQNMELLTEFKTWYYRYVLLISFFTFFIIYSHTTGRLKLMLQNMIGIVLSGAIISIASYECFLSVKFLRTLLHKRQLYQ
jgi:hypothetical protein